MCGAERLNYNKVSFVYPKKIKCWLEFWRWYCAAYQTPPFLALSSVLARQFLSCHCIDCESLLYSLTHSHSLSLHFVRINLSHPFHYFAPHSHRLGRVSMHVNDPGIRIGLENVFYVFHIFDSSKTYRYRIRILEKKDTHGEFEQPRIGTVLTSPFYYCYIKKSCLSKRCHLKSNGPLVITN